MKTIALVLLVVSYGSAVDLQAKSWFTFRNMFFSDAISYGCETGSGNTCADCRTIMRCDNQRQTSCAKMDASKPYCNPITKTCQADNTCGGPEMNCPYRGFFPEPLLCNKFQFCSGKDAEAEVYECPPNQRWDAVKQICTQTATCVNFNMQNGLCKGKFFEYVQHPQLPNMFMFCDGDHNLEACPSQWERVTNLKDGICGFVCRMEGFFPDSQSSTKFWACVKEGKDVLKAYSMDCAEGTEFNEEVNFCMPSNSSGEEPVPTTTVAS